MTHTLLLLLLTFLAGAGYECGCVFWVHYSERRRRLPAACFSMAIAVMTAKGIEQSIHGWIFVMAYALGYGTGTTLGITIKDRWLTPPKTPS